MLIARMFDEARRYRLTRLALRGFDDVALLDRIAEAHFVEIVPGSPLRLCFCARASGGSRRADASA